MARYAQVHAQHGYVANVIEWDGNEDTWKPPAGYMMVEDPDGMAGPGGTYQNGQFIPPPGGLPGSMPAT